MKENVFNYKMIEREKAVFFNEANKHFDIDLEIEENKKMPFVQNYYDYTMKFFKGSNFVLKELENHKGMIYIIKTYNAFKRYFSEKTTFKEEAAESLIKELIMPFQFCYNWNIYKQVYNFNKECFDFLKSNAKMENISCETLNDNLPYEAFYIENHFEEGNVNANGVIVNKVLRSDNEVYLGLAFIKKSTTEAMAFFFIPLETNHNLKECFYDYLNENKELAKNYYKLIEQALNCILYLCSYNKEIRKLECRNSYEKKLEKHRKNKNISSYDVGYVLGSTIKQTKTIYKYENTSTSTEKGKGAPKRPHTRCAHYQIYWTGKKDGSEERKSVIKFIPPLFINGINQKITLHKVEK